MRGTRTKGKMRRRHLGSGFLAACSPFPPLVATPSTGMMAINQLVYWEGVRFGDSSLRLAGDLLLRGIHHRQAAMVTHGRPCLTSSCAGRRRSRHSTRPDANLPSDTSGVSPLFRAPEPSLERHTSAKLGANVAHRHLAISLQPRKAKIGFESPHVLHV